MSEPAPLDSKAMRAKARVQLLADNADAPLEAVERYLDAWVDYRVAQANVDEHGTIVMHPRTGSPIENPYLRIRAAASKAMDASDLETDALWEPETGEEEQ